MGKFCPSRPQRAFDTKRPGAGRIDVLGWFRPRSQSGVSSWRVIEVLRSRDLRGKPRLLFPELACHGFWQVFFKLRGQPLLQQRHLLRGNQQRAQPGTAFLVVPANLGLNPEAILLAGENERNPYPRSRLQRGDSVIAMPPSLTFISWQLASLPWLRSTAATLSGQRKERRRSRTINPNAAFSVYPTDRSESGFSITKFG